MAQGKGSSIMTYASGTPGAGKSLADMVRNEIGIGLLQQFPCVDQMDDDVAAALVGLERWKQLLGAETSDATLAEIGGAVGARYIIVVRTSVLPNGDIYTSTVVIDTQTARMVASRDTPPAKPNDAVTAGKALVNQILNDLANILKGQCDEHWTGSISYSHRKEVSKNESSAGYSSGQHIPAKITVSTTERLDETADILLQAMALGSSGDSTMSRVVQKYHYQKDVIRNESGTTPCREPGRNPYRRDLTGDEKEIRTQNGQNTLTVPVTISVSPTGDYRIMVYKIDKVKTTGRFERSGNLMGCKPNPFSSIAETDGVSGVGYIDLKGKVDPIKADILVGKIVEGDIVNGQKTWSWNLRLVKPKKN